MAEGTYECVSHFFTYPFITWCDNYNMTEEEVINWMDSSVKYTLEVYDNTMYTKHGNGD